MSLRRTPFRRVLHRPNLFLGGERELTLSTAVVAVALAVTGQNLIALGVAALLLRPHAHEAPTGWTAWLTAPVRWFFRGFNRVFDGLSSGYGGLTRRLVRVPVIVLLLVVGPFVLPESRDPHPGPFDLASAALSLVTMFPLISALKTVATEGPTVGAALSAAVGVAAARRTAATYSGSWTRASCSSVATGGSMIRTWGASSRPNASTSRCVRSSRRGAIGCSALNR